jgi:hypothetical protein
MKVVYRRGEQSRLKEFLMRYTPVALALSLLAAVTGSMGQARTGDPIDPRAQTLLQDGRSALARARSSMRPTALRPRWRSIRPMRAS